MKIRSKVADLHAAVAAVVAASDKTTLSVASRVRIVADATGCTLEATNYDLHACAPLACEVVDEGSALPLIRPLLTFLRNLPQDAIAILTSAEKVQLLGPGLVIEAGRSRVTLCCLAPEEWPDDVGREVYGDPLPLPVDEMIRLLTTTAYARSADLSQPDLCAVDLAVDEAARLTVRIAASATDGHRMAMNSGTVALPDGSPIGLRGGKWKVPGSLIKQVLPRLAEAQALAIEVSKDQRIRFTIDGITLAAKLGAGKPTDFSGVIARQEAAATIVVDKIKLMAAIDQMGGAIGRSTPLALSVVKGSLRLYAARELSASGLLRVDGQCTVHDTDALKPVGVPLHQLRSAVQACGDHVELQIPASPNGPAVEVRSAGDTNHRQLIARTPLDKPLPADRQEVEEVGDDD